MRYPVAALAVLVTAAACGSAGGGGIPVSGSALVRPATTTTVAVDPATTTVAPATTTATTAPPATTPPPTTTTAPPPTTPPPTTTLSFPEPTLPMVPGACLDVVAVGVSGGAGDPTPVFGWAIAPLDPSVPAAVTAIPCEESTSITLGAAGPGVELRIAAPEPWDGGPYSVHWVDGNGGEEHIVSFARLSPVLTAAAGDTLVVRRHDRGLEVVPDCDDPASRRPLVHQRLAVSYWDVYVECLLHDTPGTLDGIIGYLEQQMHLAASLLPPASLGALRHTPVWVDRSYEDATTMALYMEDVQEPGSEDLPYLNGIRVSAEAVEDELAYGPGEREEFAVHELAHAWHCLAFDPCWSAPKVAGAYASAMLSGIYAEVEYVHGGTERAYAATDDGEYFAELTEAWFSRNDYYPFDRDDLLAHDPVGAAAVEEAWGLEP